MLISFLKFTSLPINWTISFIFDDKSVALFSCVFFFFSDFWQHTFFVTETRVHETRKRRKIYASTPWSCRVLRSTAVDFQTVNERRNKNVKQICFQLNETTCYGFMFRAWRSYARSLTRAIFNFELKNFSPSSYECIDHIVCTSEWSCREDVILNGTIKTGDILYGLILCVCAFATMHVTLPIIIIARRHKSERAYLRTHSQCLFCFCF